MRSGIHPKLYEVKAVCACGNSFHTRSTVEELREFCKTELAPYKVPWKIEFLDELPKSSMMKILRKDLRQQELGK